MKRASTKPEYDGEFTHEQLRALPRHTRKQLRRAKGRKRHAGIFGLEKIAQRRPGEFRKHFVDELHEAARLGLLPHPALWSPPKYVGAKCMKRGHHQWRRTPSGESAVCDHCKSVVRGLDPTTAPKPFKGHRANRKER